MAKGAFCVRMFRRQLPDCGRGRPGIAGLSRHQRQEQHPRGGADDHNRLPNLHYGVRLPCGASPVKEQTGLGVIDTAVGK